MYINLDNQEVDITKMTRGFIKNALERLTALIRAPNISLKEQEHVRLLKKVLEAELVERRKLRFKVIKD